MSHSENDENSDEEAELHDDTGTDSEHNGNEEDNDE